MNRQGFSIIEIITSVTIFVIFATGYTMLMSQNNTMAESEQYLLVSSELIGEAQEIIRNSGAASFSSGSWSMTSLSWAYAFYSGASLSTGLYVDELGRPASSTGSATYKRLIVVSTGSTVYTGSTNKSVNIPSLSVDIRIWYPGCDFNKTYCVYRSVTVH